LPIAPDASGATNIEALPEERWARWAETRPRIAARPAGFLPRKAAGWRVLFLTLTLATFAESRAQSSEAQASGGKVEKEFYTPKDRQQAIRRALVFTPKPVADSDVMQGPEQNRKQFQFHFNDRMTCDFDKPGAQMGGQTPKFECKITRVESPNGEVQVLTEQMEEEPVKVKFGADDKELYAEVAATRLLWALGFYADSWFAVHVECHNCPADLKSGSGNKSTRTFDAATVVRKFEGHKMYEVGKPEQGWSWKEFENLNGRPSYEKDALKLIAAVISHSDNKPPQQRVVCKDVNVDQSTSPFTTTCKESRMLVQDVGATFGSGGWFTSNSTAKMNLHEWSGKKVWSKAGTAGMNEADCPVCQATLRKSLTATDGLSDPVISEEGRRFAAGLMCQLTDRQIEDLFRVARVATMPEYHNGDGSFKQGLDESTIVRQWADAFKHKREEVASGRCRWKAKPTDFTLIDNPANLPSVPNYCTARPF
jgi:hypothetical protein